MRRSCFVITMLRVITIFLIFTLVGGATVKKANYKLDIIHYNDFHARYYLVVAEAYVSCSSIMNNEGRHINPFVDMFALKWFVSVALFSLVDGFALPFEGLYELDIIHYNDFHARMKEVSYYVCLCANRNQLLFNVFVNVINDKYMELDRLSYVHTKSYMYEETSVDTPTCHFNNGSCLGGFPRLYSEIMQLKKEKPNSLLLNAGDSFQGTYWYTLLKWNITQEFMNLLPHDAHAIGNHEFDDGPEGLAPYLRALKAPVLAANMDVSKEPLLQDLFTPHIIVKRGGRKIGIIGLITTDTKKLSSPGNVVFTDPLEATDREAKLLTDKGIDIIIVLSHCGLEMDKQIAREHGKHVDIIIGGHSHSLLWNGPAPSGEKVEGPYPVFIETSKEKEHQVLIVQASAFTKYMGNLTVYFDYLGRYVKWEGGPIFLDRSIPEDEKIKKKLEPYAKLVHEAENVPVGEAVRTLNADDCVFGECTIGDLLVDALTDYAKANVKSDYDHLAFIQRGNIKASILSGKITKGTIFDVLPFKDRVVTFELQGRYVREALERSVIEAWGLTPFKGPWLLQVSGLNVTYNISLPEGQRIVSVNIGNSGAILDDDKYYQVTMPAYLADGGDGFTMFQTGKKNVKIIGRDERILEIYINKNSPIDIRTDGRIEILQ